jgi:hypothetical protein
MNNQVCRAVVLSSVDAFVQASQRLLVAAKQTVSELGTEEFISKRLSGLFGIVQHYCQLYDNLQIKTRAEVDDVIRSNYRYLEIQEVHDSLLTLETDWDQFLEGIDSQLIVDAQKAKALDVGDVGLSDVQLKCLDNELVTSLRDCQQPSDLLPCHWLIVVLLRHFA